MPSIEDQYRKFGKRHILAFWLFTGFINVYILRVSINVAIVSMVNATSSHESSTNGTCPMPEKDNATSSQRQGDFNWDHETQGVILSSFYYGYICTQFIGGYLARIVGGRIMFGVGVGMTALLTLVNPVAARTSPELLIAIRVMEGLFEGVTFPSAHFLLGNWAPQKERTTLVSFPFSGPIIGTVISAPLTGLLCEYGFDGGWASSFYVFGSIGVVWCFGWFYFVHDSPACHPTISHEERLYVEKFCHSTNKPVPFMAVPWKEIALSPAVWGLTLAHTCFNWNFYTLLTEMSTYLKDELHVGVAVNGIISSIPYVCYFIFLMIAAPIADVVRAKGVSTKVVRKISYSLGMVFSAIALVIIGFVGCSLSTVVAIMCIAVGFVGFSQASFVVNHVDLAPQYASILMGITNTVATVPGMLSPVITGIIINKQSTIETWRIVFYISGAISVFGAIMFTLLGDGTIQPWAKVQDSERMINEELDDDSVDGMGPDDKGHADDSEIWQR